MKESNQLNVAYEALCKKYGRSTVAEVADNLACAIINGKTIYCDGQHDKGEFFAFDMGYEFTRHMKPDQRLYALFTDWTTYIFACHRITDVIKEFKHELAKSEEDFPV
jgi:hypothetical protein